MKAKSKIYDGHVLYYLRGYPKIIHDLSAKEYESVYDFGVTPLCIVDKFLPEIGVIALQKIYDYIEPRNIKIVRIYGDLKNESIKHNMPWLMSADKIVPVLSGEDIKRTKKLPLKSKDYTRVFKLNEVKRHYKDFINGVEMKEIPPVEFIINILGKDFSFIKDIFYDYMEYYFWTGINLFSDFHVYLENILKIHYIDKLYDISGMYWKSGKSNYDLKDYIES
ncbi:MAG: hypothetical protein QXF12_00970 [Candidatus Aenigmatarchaeota archaeon]